MTGKMRLSITQVDEQCPLLFMISKKPIKENNEEIKLLMKKVGTNRKRKITLLQVMQKWSLQEVELRPKQDYSVIYQRRKWQICNFAFSSLTSSWQEKNEKKSKS